MPTATPLHLVRVSAGPATVEVTADDEAVTNWITQYFGSWWKIIDDTDGAVCAVDPAEQVAYHVDADETTSP